MASSYRWASTAVSPRYSSFLKQRCLKSDRKCYVSDDTYTRCDTTHQEPIPSVRRTSSYLLRIQSSFGGNTRPHPSCDPLHATLRTDAVELWCRDYQLSIRISVKASEWSGYIAIQPLGILPMRSPGAIGPHRVAFGLVHARTIVLHPRGRCAPYASFRGEYTYMPAGMSVVIFAAW